MVDDAKTFASVGERHSFSRAHSMNELVMPDVYVEIIRERPRSVGAFFCVFVICGGWSKFKT